ncbi:MAG: TonB-dependent receptor, partial [bacterium]
RTWSELTEDSRGLDLDLTYKIGRGKLKAGVSTSKRERDYRIEAWFTDTAFIDYSDPENWGLAILPIDQRFAPENYGPGKFRFDSVTPFAGEYTASHDFLAYYGMVDSPFRVLRQRFRVAGGVRVEDSDQQVAAVAAVDEDKVIPSRINETDVLPSLNLTYMLNEVTNLRLAYFESVNRPEFREMAAVLYYDFDHVQNVRGNPNLKRARLSNYDVRLEFFPDIGEVIAGSFFYKTIENAIEEELIPSPERYVRTWFNSERGKNYGFELEMKKRLGTFGDYFDNFMVSGNYTHVNSAVEYLDERTVASGDSVLIVREIKERLMQGQAPWAVNLSLLFTEPHIGTTFSLLYNRIARRLAAVGDSRDSDVYEEGRDMFDVAMTQRFFGGSQLKFTIKNIGGKEDVYTFGEDEKSARIYRKAQRGTTYALEFSYTF